MRRQPSSSASAESGDFFSDFLEAIGWKEEIAAPPAGAPSPPTRARRERHLKKKKHHHHKKRKASPAPTDPAGDQLDAAERGGWLAMENLASLHINDTRRPRASVEPRPAAAPEPRNCSDTACARACGRWCGDAAVPCEDEGG